MSYVIAEIGFNHEGNMKLASEMIKAASDSGANAVKFQTFKAIDIALPTSPHYSAIKNGEMDFSQHQELFSIAKENAIDFISTPFSVNSIELLEKIGVSAYKVASMDCTNHHLLKYISQTKKPVYLSTGMAELSEISETLEYLESQNSGQISILHCISIYPAEVDQLNLEMIPFLKHIFNIPVGYSDHYPGTKACLLANFLGAEILETHFTLDSSKEGGDHFHSADPSQLKALIKDIEEFKSMRGSPKTIFQRKDRSFAQVFRRGVYSSKKLLKGDILKESDFILCRPESSFTPDDVEQLIGKKLCKDIEAYQPIESDVVRV